MKLNAEHETVLEITDAGYLLITQKGSHPLDDVVALSPGQIEQVLKYYERNEQSMRSKWNSEPEG